jgi:transcriptional regulator with XRE-family HTH domain
VTGQSVGNSGDQQLSSQELEFLRHWRPLIQRLGEQKQVAETMAWSTSTVSRDYRGETLPNDERLRELSNYLKFPPDRRVELAVLLRRARDARQARLQTGPDPEPDPASNAGLNQDRPWRARCQRRHLAGEGATTRREVTGALPGSQARSRLSALP